MIALNWNGQYLIIDLEDFLKKACWYMNFYYLLQNTYVSHRHYVMS
jgi:hypothetical protein